VNSVVLRWPDAALSPNGRVHYMTRHRAVTKYRSLARYLGDGQKRLKKPVCAVLPLVATKRRRDLDNVLASLKSALDGLTDAGWWEDDHDITGFHIIPEVYCKLWDSSSVLILATEELDLPAMSTAIAEFKAEVIAGTAHHALAKITRRDYGPASSAPVPIA
jgi:Holliday junction resolvase RusA-like endonuclease